MLHQAIFFGVIATIVGAACTLAEVLRPARPLVYRRVLLADAVSFAIYIAVVTPVAAYFSNYLGIPYQTHFHFWRHVWHWPLPIRIAIYYLVADFGSYVLHRIMHTRYVWRIHKWHHAPRYMYWFAGVRATVQQQFLFNLPYVFAIPIVTGAPAWVYTAFVIELIFRNDWMHMNVAWRSNWIEWIFVTPRYHAIHHCPDLPGNYGSLFSIWDRLFGTRIDPDIVAEPLRFGTGEDDNRIRLVVGV